MSSSGGDGLPEQTTDAFTIAFMSDTHNNNATHDAIFRSQIDYLVANPPTILLHSGDLQNTGSADDHWDEIDATIGVLDTAEIPYLLTVGNHDYDAGDADNRNVTKWNAIFPQARYTGRSWWSGGFAEAGHSENAYCILNIGGTDWLFMVMEFGPRQDIIDWANTILTANSTKPTVIATHLYLAQNGDQYAVGNSYDVSEYGIAADAHNGGAIWTELITLHDNIRLVLCGHDITQYNGMSGDYGCLARRVDKTAGDVRVNQMLANYQLLTNAGNGYMRFLSIDPTTQTIRVTTRSPYLGTSFTDDTNQFGLWW